MGGDSPTFSLCLNLHDIYCALHTVKDSDKLAMFKKGEARCRNTKSMFKELEMFSLEKRKYMEKQHLFSDTQKPFMWFCRSQRTGT